MNRNHTSTSASDKKKASTNIDPNLQQKSKPSSPSSTNNKNNAKSASSYGIMIQEHLKTYLEKGEKGTWEERGKLIQYATQFSKKNYDMIVQLFGPIVSRLRTEWMMYCTYKNLYEAEVPPNGARPSLLSHNTVYRNMFDNLCPQHKMSLVSNLMSNFVHRKVLSVQYLDFNKKGDAENSFEFEESIKLNEADDKLDTFATLQFLQDLIIKCIDVEIIWYGSYEMRKRLDPSFNPVTAAFPPLALKNAEMNMKHSIENKRIKFNRKNRTALASKEHEEIEAQSDNQTTHDSTRQILFKEYQDIPHEHAEMMKDTLPHRYTVRKMIADLVFNNFVDNEDKPKISKTLHKNECFSDWILMIAAIFNHVLLVYVPDSIHDLITVDIPLDPLASEFDFQAKWIKDRQAKYEATFSIDRVSKDFKRLLTYGPKEKLCSCCQGRREAQDSILPLVHPAKYRMKYRMNCAYCRSKLGKYLCASCHVERYCSVECQKAHWKDHKHLCHDICAMDNIRKEVLAQFNKEENQ
ncbi:hypothetical protein C9374_014672 [Naegleria lovaniensis]|uniref:MYND-type domain-containing protein n=1 Tax=Naegleria lovaniensis TaxID=51637 RepID=A0AA88GUT4_NAELO|nr:uncharacterized protein C9374_014672 [Naegleria lovaniensis]KAG2389272.1 hypothetical protein C9374_014672 [Naegleria lovaniensis]